MNMLLVEKVDSRPALSGGGRIRSEAFTNPINPI